MAIVVKGQCNKRTDSLKHLSALSHKLQELATESSDSDFIYHGEP